MDLREKRTQKNIKNAFIELRAHKALEQITVKELSELAQINKATFYQHYRNIYDLSDCLQKEVIENILDSLYLPDLLLSDVSQFNQALFHAFYSQKPLIDILFSGVQASVLPTSIEQELKNYFFQIMPELEADMRSNILLSYQIQGGYHAYMENCNKFDSEHIIKTLNEITELPPFENLRSTQEQS